MTATRPRWRSRGVDLVLLGTAGSLATLLSGCSSDTSWSGDNHRNVYASAADCAVDYSPTVCAARGSQEGFRFLGPGYRVRYGSPSACSPNDPGPGRGVQSPRTDIQRGGFGPRCSSRRFSSRSRSWAGWGG